jgi:transposase-like protein
MNRLENLNKKFEKEIKDALENRVAYPKTLKEGLQKLMVTNHKNDERGFSPQEIYEETGMNPDLLYRWRYQALDPNGEKYNKAASKKVTKKEVSKNPSKKKSKSKADEKIDWKFKNQEFKDAIAEKICRSHINSQLNDILKHKLIDMKSWEIDDIKKTIKTASLLIEEIQDFSNGEVDFDDFLRKEIGVKYDL